MYRDVDWVLGVQYVMENEMFGNYEELAKTLMKERSQTACCRAPLREWCRLECRPVSRHG
jgi:hypothetical protein